MDETSLQFVNLAVIAAYILLIVGVGAYFTFRRKTAEGFMTANQSLPGWLIGLSMFGSYISSVSFLANPAQSFAGNWLWAVFTVVTPVGLLFGATVFVKFYRRTGEVSAYSHLERRFGRWARTYAVLSFLVMQMARMGTILFLLANVVLPLCGADAAQNIWLMRGLIVFVGLLITFYTLFGGIEAVVWVGALQSVVLLAGPVICIVALVLKTPDGLMQIIRTGVVDGKFGLGPYTLDLAAPTFWTVATFAIVGQVANWATDQSYIQRYVSARSERDARRSIWIAGLLYMPVAFVFWFIGTALYVFYQSASGRLPDGLPPDAVFPHFIAHELVVGLSGLVIAAVFAASMDSNLNSMATLTLVDGYKRYIRPHAGDRESLWVLYTSTFFWGLMSIGWGMVMTLKGAATTIEFSARVAGLLAGGLFGLVVLAMLPFRVTKPAALLATAFGVAIIVWMTVSRTSVWPDAWAPYASPFNEILALAIGSSAIVGSGVLLSWLIQSRRSAHTEAPAVSIAPLDPQTDQI